MRPRIVSIRQAQCAAGQLRPGPALTTQSSSSASSIRTLTIAAIGIVYGDIGTSPLYTMKEVFSAEHGIALNQANLLGVVSLIVWGLTIIVSLKYVTLILRADNRGEGGVMSLMALALESVTAKSRWTTPLMLVGLAGAALFYGDGVITPAISVLSAIEGLEVATPAMKPYVVPLTVAVLVGLYLLQSKGTGGIGSWFGPVIIGVVRRAGRHGRGQHRAAARHPGRAQPVACDRLPAAQPLAGLRRRWARWCWPSPAPRRCMPTWATSASGRYGWPGSWWCSRRWR